MTSKKRSNIFAFCIFNFIIGLLVTLFVYTVCQILWLGIIIAILVIIINIRSTRKKIEDIQAVVKPSLQSSQEEVPNIFVHTSIGKAIGSFKIQIPLNINYNNLLESFKKKYEGSFKMINPKISDINFANITDKLTPGEVYQGEFYPLLNRITTDECRTFLLSKKSLMTGPQGLAFLWELAKEKIPNRKYTISLDYNDRVIKENELALFPFIDHISDQQDEFELLSKGILWLPNGCIFTIKKRFIKV